MAHSGDEPRVLDAQSGQFLADLYEQHKGLVYRHCCYVLTGDRATAEDAAMETFMAALKNFTVLRGLPEAAIKRWLLTTGGRAALRQVELRRPDRQLITGDIPDRADPNDAIAATAGRLSSRELVHRAYQALDDDQQKILTLIIDEANGKIERKDFSTILNKNPAAVRKAESRMTTPDGYLAYAILTVYMVQTQGAGCDVMRRLVEGAAVSPLLREAVTAHVTHCTDCRGTRDTLPKVLAVIRTFPLLIPPDHPDHLQQRILHNVSAAGEDDDVERGLRHRQ